MRKMVVEESASDKSLCQSQTSTMAERKLGVEVSSSPGQVHDIQDNSSGQIQVKKETKQEEQQEDGSISSENGSSDGQRSERGTSRIREIIELMKCPNDQKKQRQQKKQQQQQQEISNESNTNSSPQGSVGPSMCSLNTTARGRPLIIYNGYEHRQVRADPARNLKAYRCIKKRCKGRLHTNFDNSHPRIVSDHIHGPNFDAEFKRKRRSLLRELAQKGDVSPSQIIQKARELELQYSNACEATKSSYAAERRYIQRYWNRQKQQEFANGASLLSMQQLLNQHLKMEATESDDSVSGGNPVRSGNTDQQQQHQQQQQQQQQQPDQLAQLLQLTSAAIASGATADNSSAAATNVWLNMFFQQMLSNTVSGNANNFGTDMETDANDEDERKDTSTYQERLTSLMEQTVAATTPASATEAVSVASPGRNGVIDVAVQTNSTGNESGIRCSGSLDAAVRDTLAMELGAMLAKNFWPVHYSREDKLKLIMDVIGKLLGTSHIC